MKIIQIENNVVVDILNAREDATNENVIVVEAIPEYVQKEGYGGELRYSPEKGLYWEYIEKPSDEERELTADEAMNIILGGEIE